MTETANPLEPPTRTAPALHDAAAKGFAAGSGAYERGRPSFPPAAVSRLQELLGIAPGRRIVDLGAGTGKMTRLLSGFGAHLIGVEPVAAMRTAFAAVLPGTELHDAQAEALPFASATIDGIVCAQA